MTNTSSRDAILASARAEFAAHGYAGSRVDRIAARAQLNKQLIYYYFGSKAGLHAAATASNPDRGLPTEPSPATATEGLRSAIGAMVQVLGSRPDIVSLLVERAATDEARRRTADWIRRAEDDLAAAVSHGQGLGYFRDDADPRAIARQALVLCVGYLALAPHLSVAPADWVRQVGDTLIRATAW